MILGQDIFPELQIYLCFSNFTISVNGGDNKVCTTPMKDWNKVYVKTSTKQFDDKNFQNEKLWENKHVLDATQRTYSILDVKYQKAYSSKITSYIKYLSSDKQGMLYNVRTKYEFPFNGTLVTWKNKPVY